MASEQKRNPYQEAITQAALKWAEAGAKATTSKPVKVGYEAAREAMAKGTATAAQILILIHTETEDF